MKKAIAKIWVKALRSGKFEQAEGFLKRFDRNDKPSHCCLGVLCELYNDTMKKNQKKSLPVEVYKNGDGTTHAIFGSSDATLPNEVMEWAGMKSMTGDLVYCDYSDLTCMNDEGEDFDTIADTIEKNVENL
jgi:hypothetical protein